MKPNFGREMVLLTLPILLIGGVAFWKGKAKSWSGWGAPLGLFDGKPRLEISDWKSETPTALDFARGISSRWTVTMWTGGACPTGQERPDSVVMSIPTDLYFAWKRAGKWHTTPFQYKHSELDVIHFWGRKTPPGNEVHLGLPMDLVPDDAQEVRLRGHWSGWMMCSSGSIKTASPPLDILLKSEGEKWPKWTGSRQTPLKLLEVTQEWDKLNGKPKPGISDWEIKATFSYSGASTDDLQKARSHVTDEKGRLLFQTGNTSFRVGKKGRAYGVWNISSSEYRGSKGPLTLKSWVYVDKNEWPLEVSIPLTIGVASKTSR